MIASKVLGEQAYELVKKMIVKKQLKPGQKIVQDKLAEDLGISRTPLRYALQVLESENLVESIPRKGVVVKEFSHKEMLEVFECRVAIEGLAAKLIAEKKEAQIGKKLAALFEPFLAGPIDVAKYQVADSKFHHAIVKNCGNSFLERMFNISHLLTMINAIGLVRPPEETLEEHLAIIKSIADGDGAGAEQQMKQHLEITLDLINKEIIDED